MITTKQRAYLRGLANGIDPIFQIGKGGISPQMISEIYDALEARELVKITVLKNCELTTREACDAIVARTGSEPVQCIGGKFVIYKKSRENQTIVLD